MNRYLDALKAVLTDHDIEPRVFVDFYHFDVTDADIMMATVRDEIARCDFLIAEVSDKAIGVGVEVGYALGLGKPVVYMRQLDAEHSTTVAGMSTHQIIYESIDDMTHQLSALLSTF